MTNPMPAPGPVLVAKPTACSGTMLPCWALATGLDGDQWIEEWRECITCRHKCGLNENPEHSAPVEAAKVASLPEGSICPF